MKTFHPSLAAQYASPSTTLATAWRVTLVTGAVFGMTDHDTDVTIAGVTYYAAGGLSPSMVDSTADFEGDTIDVSAFLGQADEADLQSGDWDDAAVLVFEYNWAAPPTTLDATTVNILRRGWIGEVQRTTQQLKAEVLGLVQRLRTRIGAVYSPTCRYRFGDAFCTKDLGPLTFSGTLTGVGSDPHLLASDTSQSQAAGVFNFGELRLTSGRNAGRQMDVRTWNNQTFRLMRPLPYPLAVGDTYTAIAGCDKRVQTCQAYGNVVNFGGEPHIPGVDKLHANDIQAAPQPPPPAPPDGNPDPGGGGLLSEGA